MSRARLISQVVRVCIRAHCIFFIVARRSRRLGRLHAMPLEIHSVSSSSRPRRRQTEVNADDRKLAIF